jgi:hypothetical protein
MSRVYSLPIATFYRIPTVIKMQPSKPPYEIDYYVAVKEDISDTSFQMLAIWHFEQSVLQCEPLYRYLVW